MFHGGSWLEVPSSQFPVPKFQVPWFYAEIRRSSRSSAVVHRESRLSLFLSNILRKVDNNYLDRTSNEALCPSSSIGRSAGRDREWWTNQEKGERGPLNMQPTWRALDTTNLTISRIQTLAVSPSFLPTISLSPRLLQTSAHFLGRAVEQCRCLPSPIHRPLSRLLIASPIVDPSDPTLAFHPSNSFPRS